MNAIAQKEFPANYSTPLLRVLDALSMTDLKGMKVMGTASVRSQQYAADLDAMDFVNAPSVEAVARKFQDLIKDVRTLQGVYFGDIKCGEIPEWNVMETARIEDGKVAGFNRVESKARVDALREEGVLKEKEALDAHRLLDSATDPLGVLTARKELRFHILRWTPADILEGAMVYRDKVIKLEDALASGGMVKVDTIALVQDRFTEVSVIYDIKVKGKRITANPPPLVPSLQEDILYYSKSSPFKALKRAFALARQTKNTKVINALVPLLNSDLGRLYQLISDMGTIVDLLGHPSPPVAKLRSAIDDFRSRLGFLYQLPDVLRAEHDILGDIYAILKLSSVSKIRTRLETLRESLQGKLNRDTRKAIRDLGKHSLIAS